jgi:hypothetical protein
MLWCTERMLWHAKMIMAGWNLDTKGGFKPKKIVVWIWTKRGQRMQALWRHRHHNYRLCFLLLRPRSTQETICTIKYTITKCGEVRPLMQPVEMLLSQKCTIKTITIYTYHNDLSNIYLCTIYLRIARGVKNITNSKNVQCSHIYLTVWALMSICLTLCRND